MDERIEGQHAKEGKDGQQERGLSTPASGTGNSGRYDETGQAQDSQAGMSGSEVMGAVGGTATERAASGEDRKRED